MTATEIRCINGPLPLTLTDEELYNYFIKEVFHKKLFFNNMPIKFFTTPVEVNKIQGYFHLTTKYKKNFGIKIRMKEKRAYFINYIVPMINNSNTCSNCTVSNCTKIKVWNVPHKDTKRTKLLYYDDNYAYIIILEQKKNEYYVISSFLIDEPGYLNKILSEYQKYKK